MSKYTVFIIPERYKACGLCREVCRKDVFADSGRMNEQGYQYLAAVNGQACVGCLRCLAACPDFSIEFSEEPA